MRKAHVEANSWQVMKYIELWHRMERMTATPDAPMNRLERGSSKPPVGDHALDLMHANAEASRVLEPILRDVRGHDVSFGGISLNAILDDVRQDPGAVRRWRGFFEQGVGGEGAKRWLALKALCRLVSQALAAKHDTEEAYVLKVHTDPQDAEANNPTQAAARDREAARAEQYERGRQMRVKRLRELREKEKAEYGKCDVETAMRLWMADRDMSWWTIERAIQEEPEGEELKREKGRVA